MVTNGYTDTGGNAPISPPINPYANAAGTMAQAQTQTPDQMANWAPALAPTGSVQGTNPNGGFSARYSPVGLENIWQNPWAILPDVFNGINMAGAGYQGLRNLAADPMTLYEIMQGRGNQLTGTPDANGAQTAGSGTSNYANWLASLYKSFGSVGGRGFSAGELLQNLFSPQGGAAAGGSSLQNLLETGDASTQMRTLFNMAKDATNVGMNPLAARGYQGALSRAGDQAMNEFMKNAANGGANNVPIYQLIKQIAPGLAP